VETGEIPRGNSAADHRRAGARQGPVVILGAGLTGLSAAWHLRQPFMLVERAESVGGKARSHRRQGHTFDITGHWLHLRDARVQALVRELCADQEWVEVERRTSVHSHGARLEYPFQANLHGLPLEVVQECLVGFVEAREAAARGDAPAQTFEQYAVARFGRGIARHFFVPYNTKLWGMHPDQLTSSWVSRFVPVPDARQVIGGALGLRQEGLGYNASFTYPRAGGIDHLPTALRSAIDSRIEGEPDGASVHTGSSAEEVDVVARRVKLSDRKDWVTYDSLISTIPLPELVARTPAAPEAVRAASRNLRSVRWRYLDLATSGAPATKDHWIYVPEERFPFFRVGVYSNVVEAMAPEGAGSLYVELTDRIGEPDIQGIVEALVEIGAIGSVEDLRFCEVRDVEHAYVVFDDAHAAATKTVLDWYESQGVCSCGRYGAWTYNSMEDCILEGMRAARWAEGRVSA
jgi:protoporphyrinogen oxidase